MKKYHSFKEIDKELERLNKEAEKELGLIKTHYEDITKTVTSISTISGFVTGFVKKEVISRLKKQLKLKRTTS